MADDRTDRELMVAVRDAADRAAFEELAFRWDRRIVNYLARLTGDPEAACDLRQETLIRVWRSAGTYRETFAFSTWVTRIATNLARTHASRRNRENGRRAALETAGSLTPGTGKAGTIQAVVDSEESITLRLALEALPIPEKELLLMRFQLGLTYAEIAQAIDSPESTVKSRVARILGSLRVQLEQIGMDRSSVSV